MSPPRSSSPTTAPTTRTTRSPSAGFCARRRRDRARLCAHTEEPEPDREALAQDEAEALLQRGAELLGTPEAARYVVADRSTPEGLRALAERRAPIDRLLLGLAHRAGARVSVGNSAQRLLDGGRVAVAIASAGLADRGEHGAAVAVPAIRPTPARSTPRSRSRDALGARSSRPSGHGADLLVVGSRPEAGEGQVALSAAVAEPDRGGTLRRARRAARRRARVRAAPRARAARRRRCDAPLPSPPRPARLAAAQRRGAPSARR